MTYGLAFYELAIALLTDKLTILIDQLAPAVGGYGITLQLGSFPNGVIVIGVHIAYADSEFLLGIIEHDISIGSREKHAFLRSKSEKLGRVRAAKLHRFIECDPPLVCLGEHIRIHIFDAGAAIGDFSEVVLAPIFFVGLEWAVVCGNS